MTLLTKINSKSANIGVIGLGYVGLPLVIEFCRAGFHVTGFDVDEQKIALLRQGKSYIRHIDLRKKKGLSLFFPHNRFLQARRNGLHHHLRPHAAE